MTVIKLPNELRGRGHMALCPSCALALAGDERAAPFTREDWEVKEQGDGSLTVVCRIHGYALAGIYTTGHPEHQRGNAQIMAAAPDLLAACRAAYVSLIGDDDYAKRKDLVKTLEAAMAKASSQARMHNSGSRMVHQAQLLVQSAVVSRASLVKKLKRCADTIAADPEIAVFVIDDMEDEEQFADAEQPHRPQRCPNPQAVSAADCRTR